MENLKRVLVLSNNCFSKTNSNGRTLGNLFYTYDKTKIAQFYISGDEDDSVCENYYQVTDNDVIRSVFPFLKKNKEKESNYSSEKKRSVPNMILRNIIWDMGFWKNKRFKEWLDDFDPDCILLQIGDCTFMIKLALWVARRFNVPIILYNTEAYYFKNFNYFQDGHDFLYGIYIIIYRKWFTKIINKADVSIYLCDELKEVYDNEFKKKSLVIYNSSLLNPTQVDFKDFPVISYIGNLLLGRDKSLCDIAKVLYELDPSYVINIYGNATEETISLFNNQKAIKYHGFVSYDETQNVIRKSHILLHVESFDDFYVKDSEYGFSGKIADSLMSGRVFLVYGPNNIACVNYLKDNGVGSVAGNSEELKNVLVKIITDREYFNDLTRRQLDLAKRNHNLRINADKLKEIINDQ